MGELQAYRDRRLELGDMIRAALYMARSSGDEEVEQRARELLARLAADQFQLAVVGQFSRGKTTLMNALLGGAYLPMGALPMTSVITRVRYGSQPRAMVRRRASDLAVEVPLGDVAAFVAASSAERAELQVTSVGVEVPAEILRLGFEFVDTPGVGSAIAANTAATRKFLPQADAVMFVTGFDSPLTEAEVSFLADAARHAGKLFLVLNKRDLVTDREAGEVTEFVRCRLWEDLGMGQPRLFGLSALEALEARTTGDRERLFGSGLAPLYAALAGFLATGKTRLLLGNVTERAAALVAIRRRDLRLGRLASDGGPDPAAVLTAFDARMAELDQAQRGLAGEIEATIDSRLPGLLAARSASWQASLRELLGPCLESGMQADQGASVRDRAKFLQATLEAAGRGIAVDWLARRTGEVLELVTGMAADQIGALLQAARSPRSAAAQIAGLAGDDNDPGPGGWSADDLPDLAVRTPEWTVRMPSPRRLARKSDGDAALRHDTAEALSAAITAFEGRWKRR
jgi:GTPase SAR1 family protein